MRMSVPTCRNCNSNLAAPKVITIVNHERDESSRIASDMGDSKNNQQLLEIRAVVL